jgi:hypothetical protein
MSTKNDITHTPLEIAASVAHAAHNITSNSLAEYTRPARLEPIALIDKSLMNSLSVEHIVALEQTMVSVFSGMYLMAIGMTMKVGDIVPLTILSQFSTNRSLTLAAGNSVYWAFEGLMDKAVSEFTHMPTSEELSLVMDTNMNNASYGLEAWGDVSNVYGVGVATDPKATSAKESVDIDKTIHNIMDESNLVVGKILNVPISYGDHTTTIQTTVTLRPKSIASSDLVTICRHNSRDLSWAARWHAMRSGEISFVKDWLLNQDVIEEYRRGLHSDKTGILMNLKSSHTKNIWAAIISGRASPNAISAMMFIAKETAMDIQRATGHKLQNFHDREKIFEGTSSAWLIVVDSIRETFTIYTRGIEDTVDSSFVHIKGNAKNPKGVDINQVMEMFKLGKVSNMLN